MAQDTLSAPRVQTLVPQSRRERGRGLADTISIASRGAGLQVRLVGAGTVHSQAHPGSRDARGSSH